MGVSGKLSIGANTYFLEGIGSACRYAAVIGKTASLPFRGGSIASPRKNGSELSRCDAQFDDRYLNRARKTAFGVLDLGAHDSDAAGGINVPVQD